MTAPLRIVCSDGNEMVLRAQVLGVEKVPKLDEKTTEFLAKKFP